MQIAELRQLILTAYTSENNQLRKQAEQSLVDKIVQNIDVFQQVAEIIVMKDNFIDYAATLLNSVVMTMFHTKGALNEKHANIVANVIINKNVPQKTKQNIQKAMTVFVRIIKDTRPQLEKLMRQLIESQDLIDVQSAIIIFKVLVDSLELGSYSFVITGDISIGWMSEFFSGIHKFYKNKQEITQDRLDILKQFAQVQLELCEKAFVQKHNSQELLKPIQDLIYQHVPLSELLLCLLQFNVPEAQLKDNLISTVGQQQTDNNINELKASILKIYFLMLNIYINNRTKAEQRKGQYLTQLTQLVQVIIFSLLTYVQLVPVKQISQVPFMTTLFTYSMKILAVCGGHTELYPLYSDSKVSLITELLIPFLITGQEEQQMMKDEPEEFVNLALDTVDKQESDVPKTAAATLVETLCDHIDGSTSLLAQLSIFIIQQSIKEITKVDTPQYEQEKEFLNLISQKKIFTQYTPVDRIEACLTLLTIMSYLIQKRYDIIVIMEKLLVEHMQFFLAIPYEIVQIRLALFFGYYCDNLFKSDGENMLKFIQILINFVQPDKPALFYQAIDALKDIFEDDELKTKVKQYIPTVFPKLISAFQFSTYERHFEMISNILKNEPDTFLQYQEFLYALIQGLSQRILQEQQLVNEGKKNRFIYVNRCWNVIRSLAEIPNFIPLLGVLEQNMLPLYKAIQENYQIDFEEELILLITSIIQKVGAVTQMQVNLLPHLDRVLKKQHYRLNNLYEMLNLYMYFGHQIFLEENAQQLYFNFGLQAMQAQQDHIGESDQSEGALLIQLGIQILGEKISPKILQSLFQAAWNQLPSVQLGYLKGRILGIFLSALYVIPQQTVNLLSDMWQSIFNVIIQNKYEPGYDIKLFACTMTNLLTKEINIFSVDLISIIVQNLVVQKEYEAKKKDKDDEDLASDQDDYDDDDLAYEEEQERQQSAIQIEQFKSQIIGFDEFQMFKDLIQFYKANVPQAVVELKTKLNPLTLQKLQEILNTKRIETQDGTSYSRQMVKVKGRKRAIQ